MIILLFGWSVWPLPVATQELRINQEYIAAIAADNDYDCPLLDQLLDYSFELQIPEKIWISGTDYILLNLQRIDLQQTDLQQTEETSPGAADGDSCSLTLEARLDVDRLDVRRGTRVIAPFVGADAQTMLFEIGASDSGTASGELWIAADIYDSSAELAGHLPLFVIPVEIKVVSIFGLPPVMMRYLCLLVLMILLAIILRRRLLKQG